MAEISSSDEHHVTSASKDSSFNTSGTDREDESSDTTIHNPSWPPGKRNPHTTSSILCVPDEAIRRISTTVKSSTNNLTTSSTKFLTTEAQSRFERQATEEEEPLGNNENELVMQTISDFDMFPGMQNSFSQEGAGSGLRYSSEDQLAAYRTSHNKIMSHQELPEVEEEYWKEASTENLPREMGSQEWVLASSSLPAPMVPPPPAEGEWVTPLTALERQQVPLPTPPQRGRMSPPGPSLESEWVTLQRTLIERERETPQTPPTERESHVSLPPSPQVLPVVPQPQEEEPQLGAPLEMADILPDPEPQPEKARSPPQQTSQQEPLIAWATELNDSSVFLRPEAAAKKVSKQTLLRTYEPPTASRSGNETVSWTETKPEAAAEKVSKQTLLRTYEPPTASRSGNETVSWTETKPEAAAEKVSKQTLLRTYEPPTASSSGTETVRLMETKPEAAAEKVSKQTLLRTYEPPTASSSGKETVSLMETKPEAAAEKVSKQTLLRTYEPPTASRSGNETVSWTETKAWPARVDPAPSDMTCFKPKAAVSTMRGKDKAFYNVMEDIASQIKTSGASSMANSISSFVDSSVGKVFANTIDRALERSEEWLNYYLPQPETSAADASAKREERDTSKDDLCKEGCFVRINFLSTQLRNRAFRFVLRRLKTTRHNTNEQLSRLDKVLNMLDQSLSPGPSSFQKVSESLSNVWQQWSTTPEAPSQKQPPRGVEKSLSLMPEQLEMKALTMTRVLADELHTTYRNLLPHVAELPAHLQEKVTRVYHSMEDLHSHLTTVTSLRDLPTYLLLQSRDRITSARENLDELLEFMVQSQAGRWLSQPSTSRTGVALPSAGVRPPITGNAEGEEEGSTSRRRSPPRPPPSKDPQL